MSVTRHPPHRSRRAALPHRAPASGRDAQASEDACRTQSSTCDRAYPALRPDPGIRDHVPLGQLPSLHLLRRSHGATFVRRLPRYSEADLAIPPQARGRASRVPHRLLPCMPEVSDPARSVDTSPARRLRYGLPRVRSASAPRRSPIAGLHTLPARSPVNASRLPLPIVTHDSGPVWVANPSRSGTCTLQHSAGFSRHTRTPGLRRRQWPERGTSVGYWRSPAGQL
jgi:hypothetical protein